MQLIFNWLIQLYKTFVTKKSFFTDISCKCWRNLVSLSFKTAVKSFPKQLKIVLGAMKSPLPLYIGIIYPSDQQVGIIPVSSIMLNIFVYKGNIMCLVFFIYIRCKYYHIYYELCRFYINFWIILLISLSVNGQFSSSSVKERSVLPGRKLVSFSVYLKLYLFYNDYETSYTTYINHARWHRCLRSDGLRVGGNRRKPSCLTLWPHDHLTCRRRVSNPGHSGEWWVR